MSKKFMYPVAIVSALGAVALLAQEGTTKATEGTLMLEKEPLAKSPRNARRGVRFEQPHSSCITTLTSP